MKLELINQIKKLAAALGEKSFETRLQDGTPVKYSGDLAEGTKLFAILTEGEKAMEDGTFEFENGKIVEVKDGAVVKFMAKQDDSPKELEELFAALKEGILTEVKAMLDQSKTETEAKFAAVETSKDSVALELKETINTLLDEIKKVELAAPVQPVTPAMPGEASESRKRAIEIGLNFMNNK